MRIGIEAGIISWSVVPIPTEETTPLAPTRCYRPAPGARLRALTLWFAAATLACSGSDAPDAVNGQSSAAGGSRADGREDAAWDAAPLSPEELAAYLPREVVGLPPRPEDLNLLPFEEREDDPSRSAQATLPYGADSGPGVQLTISDLAGTNRGAARAQYYDLYLTGQGDDATEARRLDDGTVVLFRPEGTQFVPAVEYWIANRFEVTASLRLDGRNVGGDPSTVDRLMQDLYPAEPLGLLRDGPEETAPDAAWLDVSAEPTRIAEELPSCDALLPAVAVGRICGVTGVTAEPTQFEQVGRSCNRVYRPAAGGSGLVFMVTAFADPTQASGAVALEAEPGPYAVEHDVLAELGDGGNRSLDRSEFSPDRYDIRFSRGSVLVEMNVADSPFDQPDQKMCLTLEAMEELAREVDRNLGGGG